MKSIILETSRRQRIANGQIDDISQFEARSASSLRQKYSQARWRTNRLNPTYNCHGMTFASRRTSVFDSADIHKILTDDNYAEVPRRDATPGDIVLYFSDDGDIEHSGIVVSDPEPDLGIPKICSKWGRAFEVIHWANDCPYDSSNMHFYRPQNAISTK
ncbi:hypothetical protein ACFL2T_00640 [Elusimicrobiota bacterium]